MAIFGYLMSDPMKACSVHRSTQPLHFKALRRPEKAKELIYD